MRPDGSTAVAVLWQVGGVERQGEPATSPGTNRATIMPMCASLVVIFARLCAVNARHAAAITDGTCADLLAGAPDGRERCCGRCRRGRHPKHAAGFLRCGDIAGGIPLPFRRCDARQQAGSRRRLTRRILATSNHIAVRRGCFPGYVAQPTNPCLLLYAGAEPALYRFARRRLRMLENQRHADPGRRRWRRFVTEGQDSIGHLLGRNGDDRGDQIFTAVHRFPCRIGPSRKPIGVVKAEHRRPKQKRRSCYRIGAISKSGQGQLAPI